MKKFLLFLSIIIISINAHAQYFDGVLISGSRDAIISKYVAKGYELVSKKDNVAIMSGKASNQNIELYLFFTPMTYQAYKAVVYLPKHTNWYSLKSEYERMVGIFNEKYGKPTSSYFKFTSPYYEGDGYEFTAVGADKTSIASIWMDKGNLNCSVQVSQYHQVKLIYENKANLKIKDDEQGRVNMNVF